jgi:hypothetical protein
MKTQCRGTKRSTTLLPILLLGILGGVSKAGTLEEEERRIMDILVQTYGATDWSAIECRLNTRPTDAGNPNVMVIPLSLANGYLSRYESANDVGDLERAIGWLEWVAVRYPLWNQRWLTPAVAQYLDVSVLRLRTKDGIAPFFDRIDALWQEAMWITEQEADARLAADLPYRNSPDILGDPLDSSRTGDTKAEENAWEAVILSAAANFLPDHPHAADWDRKARELAYDAITLPSDSLDSFGIKTTTVTEDFSLANHGLSPNPYYMAATLFLLCQGALGYRLTSHRIPEEFGHNVPQLFAKYRTYVDESLQWTVPADPAGDATLFPLPFDPEFEIAVVARKAVEGHLWMPTAPVAALSWGSDLWTAIQNGKVVLYYLMGSYLWHVPSPWIVPGKNEESLNDVAGSDRFDLDRGARPDSREN